MRNRRTQCLLVMRARRKMKGMASGWRVANVSHKCVGMAFLRRCPLRGALSDERDETKARAEGWGRPWHVVIRPVTHHS